MPIRVGYHRCRELLEARSLRQCARLATSAAIEVANIAWYYRQWKKWAEQAANSVPDSRLE
jgi:hypothetical protein